MVDCVRDGIGLKDACLLLRGRGGKPPHPKTVQGWVREGYRPAWHGGEPVRLRAVKIGNDWVTRPAWCAEFNEALVRLGLEQARKAGEEPTAAGMRAARRAAEERLDAAGCV